MAISLVLLAPQAAGGGKTQWSGATPSLISWLSPVLLIQDSSVLIRWGMGNWYVPANLLKCKFIYCGKKFLKFIILKH